ncbi:MAG: phytoene desaturase family protein [Candidatus Helarchaeota archaeon]
MKYDAIIVGGGLGGLATNAVLISNGWKTLLLEKNQVLGGRCSGFDREGKIIDFGCHVINRGEYGPINDVLKILHVENEIEWFHSRKIPFLIMKKEKVFGPVGIDIDGPDGAIPFDFQEVVPEGIDPKNYENLLLKLADTLRGVSPKKTKKYDTLDFKSWLEEKQFPPGIKDILIFLFIAGLVSHADEGSVGELFRAIHAVINATGQSMLDKKGLSLCYPIGGCQAIPDAMVKGILKNGGEIKKGIRVQEILVKDGKVVGVRTSTGDILESDIIISNVGVKETLSLVKKEYWSRNYIEQVQDLRPSLGVLVMRLLVDTKLTNEPFLFALQEESEFYFEELATGKVPEYPPMLFLPVISNMSPNLVDEGEQLLLPAIIVSYKAVETQNYEPWKQMLEKSVKTIFPNIDDHVIWKNFFTPTNAELIWEKAGGPCIGLAQTTTQVGENKPRFTTDINGLYLTGADVGPESFGIGTELATHSGLLCGKLILRKHQKHKE